MNYTVQQIAEITHSRIIGDKDGVVKNIAYDSRIIYSIKIPLLLPSIRIKIPEKNLLSLQLTGE